MILKTTRYSLLILTLTLSSYAAENNKLSQNIELDGHKYTVELPAQSLCAVVFENK